MAPLFPVLLLGLRSIWAMAVSMALSQALSRLITKGLDRLHDAWKKYRARPRRRRVRYTVCAA